jgi:hypothetical protein
VPPFRSLDANELRARRACLLRRPAYLVYIISQSLRAEFQMGATAPSVATPSSTTRRRPQRTPAVAGPTVPAESVTRRRNRRRSRPRHGAPGDPPRRRVADSAGSPAAQSWWCRCPGRAWWPAPWSPGAAAVVRATSSSARATTTSCCVSPSPEWRSSGGRRRRLIPGAGSPESPALTSSARASYPPGASPAPRGAAGHTGPTCRASQRPEGVTCPGEPSPVARRSCVASMC